MTIKELPQFEFYETGSQIRRSSKSIKSNIVEGYGRRDYSNDQIRYYVFAQASNDETVDHLETLRETGSLKNEEIYHQLHRDLNHLGRQLTNYIRYLKSKN